MRKKRKKKGFTLIEVAAVIGIIMGLMVFFVPRVSAYVKDSKLAGAMAQAKQVVFAWDTVNTRSNKNLSDDTTVAKLIEEQANFKGYFDLTSVKNITTTTPVSTCLKIVNGDPFHLDENGKVVLGAEAGTKPTS